MSSEQKRIIIAVLLSGIVLFSWQTYFAPPVPMAPESETSTSARKDLKNGETKDNNLTNSGSENKNHTEITPAKELNVSSFELVNGEHSFIFGSDLTVKNAKNPNSLFDFESIVGKNKAPFQIMLIQNESTYPLNFSISQPSKNILKGTNGKFGVAFTATLLENGKLTLNINSSRAYRFKFLIRSKSKELENRQLRQFAFFGKDVDRVQVGDDDLGDGSLRWMGIDFNFHFAGLVFENSLLSRYQITENGVFSVETVNPQVNFNVAYIYTLKNYDHLKKLGSNLDLAVDFGIFGIVAVPILRGLQFIYKYVPNYGLAIILLTLFIRLIMFPLQYKSTKSMKKMQKIQPQMKKIREKYKDNPQKMQQETMGLMKSAGANPMGGCLPIIIQMPILFAFYQVLYNAVELVGAPFAFWIHDLSIKDPYYVLPVLMGIAMFFQTKVTPQTTTDPTQQKIMQFMPLIFCIFMKDLPAGLNLYIFVSTLFGIVQQLAVYKYTDD